MNCSLVKYYDLNILHFCPLSSLSPYLFFFHRQSSFYKILQSQQHSCGLPSKYNIEIWFEKPRQTCVESRSKVLSVPCARTFAIANKKSSEIKKERVGDRSEQNKQKKTPTRKGTKECGQSPFPSPSFPYPLPFYERKTSFLSETNAERSICVSRSDGPRGTRLENRWFPPKRFSPFQQLSCAPANRRGSNDRASTREQKRECVNAGVASCVHVTAARIFCSLIRDGGGQRNRRGGSITDNEVEVLRCKTAC